jgi:hypothetical protein
MRARAIEAAHAESPRRTVAPQARETADVQRCLRALFGGHERGTLIEVRSR